MNSPFPGMDPYLEDPDIWPDFHNSYYNELKRQLNEILPPGYQAKLACELWFHEPAASERIRPDKLLPATQVEGNRFLKIIDRKRERVVTVIEILSPSNKHPSPDRDEYLLKRGKYLTVGINLIEVDFLRAGERMPQGEQKLPKADYYIMVACKWILPNAHIWPFSVRDPLPFIRVPLEKDIAEPILDLQTCFTRVYAGGRYENEIDYTEPPRPALDGSDADWAVQLLKEKKSS